MKKIVLGLLIFSFIFPSCVFALEEDEAVIQNDNIKSQEETPKKEEENDSSSSSDKDSQNNSSSDSDTSSQDGNDSSLIPSAISGILIEATTGKILFEKEKDKQLPVASMTKMVAQIIILENIESGKIKWTDTVTVSKNAADMGGSQIYLSEGEKITVRDLMKGISMASANDATVQMAEVISGSEAKFVELMNQKVKDLGLKNTYFKNCTGLDEDGHYSSSYDMAMIARDLVLNHPDILKFSSVYEDYLREDTKNKFWLVNTNKLVRYYEGADGLKTGHTDAAKYCLAATAKKNNMRLIGVVLGEENSKVRNSEAMGLLDYGFNTTVFHTLKKKGEVVDKISIAKASSDEVKIKLSQDLGVIEEKGNEKHHYKYRTKIKDISLPLQKNAIIGKIYVYDNKKKVGQTNLVVDRSIEKTPYFKLLGEGLLDLISGQL